MGGVPIKFGGQWQPGQVVETRSGVHVHEKSKLIKFD